MSDPVAGATWPRVQAVFIGALECDASHREAWLAEQCGGDVVLRAEVDTLLAAHEQPGALERLAASLSPITSGFSQDLAIEGRRVGPYAVTRRIGGGGMGMVYEAYDHRLERAVALKFLQAQFGGDAVAVGRFRREARTVAALEHPNVCTVHEAGETDDGLLYLVMPLYKGETLRQRLNRGTLSVAEAVEITTQVLRGLAQAHGQDVIHRDVKPSNVFITADQVVKLIDFGIAKRLDPVGATVWSGPVGTLPYMSPEQALGMPVDARSDLWSVGVMLYEMFVGRRPYESGSAAVMARDTPTLAPTAIRAVRPDVSVALEQVVHRAIDPDPAQRFQSAAELEQALAMALVVPDAYASSVQGAPSRWWFMSSRVLAGALLVTIAVVAAVVASW